MNIFFIPSWYPSINQKLPGIFFREQAMALTKAYPDLNTGISTWGQNDDRMLLWAREPLTSITKAVTNFSQKPSNIQISSNLIKYHNPRFTWSRRLLSGNINRIIQANEANLEKFRSDFGEPELIHAHVGYPAGFIARHISKKTGIPYIITEQMSPFPHTYYQANDGGLIRELKETYSGSSANIAISDALAEQMKGYSIANVQVIPNLVDESLFTPSTIVSPNETFTFFCLGRMVPQKGIDILFKAFAKIEHKAILKVGGAGEELELYQQLAAALGIEHKVNWLGELDTTKAIAEYQQCDAFVLPSRHESMGVVFIEAMACGKPVVGTISGGPEEFINKDNGILVPVENVEALRNALDQMIAKAKEYDSIKIRKMVLNRFSTKTVCGKIRKLYENVIDSSSEN